jgi:murein DD-endopeptidase MepM/ murein hydrolase activator NlpD
MRKNRTLITCLVAVTLLFSSVSPTAAATRADVERHRRAAEEARRKAAAAEKLARRLAAEVRALDGRIDELQNQADALDPKITKASALSTRLRADVAEIRSECAQTEARIAETQAEYDRQQNLLAERVLSTYRQGDWFYFEMLLGSQSMGDLIARTELVSRVIESNNDIAADLEDVRISLDQDKIKLERSLEAASLKRRQAESAERNLRDLQASREHTASQQRSIQDEKSGLMRTSRKNAARLRALAEAEEAESDRIASELAGHGNGHFAGTMEWPVPSSHRITSPFGPRICPYHGRELHPGIDIGRADPHGPSLQGATIVAAGKGTVIWAGYRGGYGNTTIVDHGNGVTTLYAHQSSIKVSRGASVKKGQRIGSVGSTGNSTGPHLHFEVRVNGVPKNPHSYR